VLLYSDAVDDGETKARKLADPMDLISDIRLF